MSLFRSAPMRYYELYIPSEDAYNVVAKLAPESFVEFIDATSNNYTKPYENSVRRCKELIGKIDLIFHKVCQYGIQLPEVPLVHKIFEKQTEIIKRRGITEFALIDEIDSEIAKAYEAINELVRSLQTSQNTVISLEDYKYLLFKAREVFSSKSDDTSERQEIDFSKTTLEQLRLVNISGVIPSEDIMRFSKMILRTTKGHSILYTFNVPNDNIPTNFHSKEEVPPRTAFIVIIQNGKNLLNKVNRVCSSFNSLKRYNLQTNKEEIFQKIKEIQNTINDTKQLWAMTEKKLSQDLQAAVSVLDFGYSKYQSYKVFLQKELIIFQTLNLLSIDHYGGNPGSTMVAKIWIPEEKKGLLFALMPSVVTIRQPPTTQKPPTYFEVNEFTAPFQLIVDTYGIPRYGEVNPALFAIGIFPFLFGVMFGDIGHGGIVLAFGIWLLRDPKAKLLSDIYSMRYLVLMMGAFAFYSGWIYNQFFSVPLNVFGSCYGHAEPQEFAQKAQNCVYPFGFDPKWIRAQNQLNYFNSYKMKFAVIIGVSQMTVAIFLKMLNTLYFKNYVDLFFQWLPQQIFFFCTFGYMCILIIAKWMIPWGFERATSQAPSIIAQMIALPLLMGSTQGKPLWNMQFQQNLQYHLLLTALICVPWMLIFKPLILWWQMPAQPHKEHKDEQGHHEMKKHLMSEEIQMKENEDKLPAKKSIKENEEKQSAKKPEGKTKKKEEHNNQHDISEIAVHQIIETIQFVLGSISNTASYLRLWALSLAHGQLSRVFLQKTIGGGIQSSNMLIILIGMYFFVSITVGVILGMDSMQCFLHALRLQWVEFNSKFFKADGRKFMPLSIVEPIQSSIMKLRILQQELQQK